MIVKRLGLSQLGMSGSRHAVQRVSECADSFSD